MENFTLAGIARLATQSEERGHNFYSAMEKKYSNSEVKQIFRKLAEEELEHKQFFTKLAEKYDALPNKGSLNEQTKNYIKTIIGNHIFPTGEALEQIKTPADALGIGIEAEKESILLYQELMNLSTDNEIRQLLSDLLAEEKVHLVELRRYFNDLH